MVRSKWVAGLAVAGLVGSLAVATPGVATATVEEPVVVAQNLLDATSATAVDLSGPPVGSYGVSTSDYEVSFIQPFVAQSTGVLAVRFDLSNVVGLNDGDGLGHFALYPLAPVGTFSPSYLSSTEPLAFTPAVLQTESAVGRFDFLGLEGTGYTLVFTTANVYETQGPTVTKAFNVVMAAQTGNTSHLSGTHLYAATQNSGYADYPYSPKTNNHPSILVSTGPIASLDSSSRPLVNVDGTNWIATSGGVLSVEFTPSCAIDLPSCDPQDFSLEDRFGEQRFASTPVEIPNSGGVMFQWYVDATLDDTAPTFYYGSFERTKNAITVELVCSDEGSGVAPNELCDGPATFPRGTLDRTETIVVNDRAGNGSVAELFIPALRTSVPVITVSGVQNGKTYPYGTAVKPTCSATSSVVWDLRVQKTDSIPSVPCSGVTTSTKNSNGSLSYKFVATATDTNDVDGGTATVTVRWVVAAKPVAPAPKPVAKPVLSVYGFGTATYQGVPKIKLGKTYSNTIRVTVNGKTVVTKGAPVWLKSVASNAAGTIGTPTVKGSAASKTDTSGVWKKSTTFGQTGFRKFGVTYPNGITVYKVVYVVR